ncbi:hypothetical protein C2E25_14205 [Geothermobacter hydrogeniphilus]|uniref:Outer membrane protein TolC n=2 Tax=Geothermobacter hydrogeniphilus TaxID=1969733 RepID=A0A2K2H6Z4_9BACT|nr:hypothetical protein C2E25_14205 [Geothermobacter hydrogeniphilus]
MVVFSIRLRCQGVFLLSLLTILRMLGSPLPATAETIDFVSVQRQALEHSFALKVAGSDLALKKIEQQEAGSLYFPTLSLRYDTGYAWALNADGEAVTIGDSIGATDLSTWRNAFSLSGSLLLYDAGVREAGVEKARHGVRAAEQARQKQQLALRLQVLESYLQGVRSQTDLSIRKQILAARKQLYRALDRLRQAGTIDEARVREAALALAEEVTRMDDLELQFHAALESLTMLTGRTYDWRDTLLAPLPNPETGIENPVDVSRLPEIRELDEELAQLRAQREAAGRSMFPTVGLYGNYRWYGADADSGWQALNDLSGRDATLAVAVQWEFFSGFRDRLQVAKLDEQIRRLRWQRRQRIAELQREVATLQHLARQMPTRITHQQQRSKGAEGVDDAITRLGSRKLLDTPSILAKRIERLGSDREESLKRTRQQGDLLRLAILRQEAGS